MGQTATPSAPPAAAPASPAPKAPETKPAGTPPATGAPVDQKPPEGATAAEKRAWKLAINGKEQELDVSGIEFKDPKLEEKFKKLVQKGLGADEKFQHSAKTEKMLESFVHLLKTDPWKALSHPMIGHDARKIAEQYLAKQLEFERMDPRDREIAEHKLKLQEAEDKLKSEREEREAQQKETLTKHYSEEYSKDILTTLKTSGLPQSPRTVQRIAHYMFEGLKRGVELKATDVIDIVRQDYMDDIKALFGGLDEDALLGIVGDDVAGKIRNAELKRLKRPGIPVSKNEQPIGTPDTKPPQYKSIDNFDRLIKERM